MNFIAIDVETANPDMSSICQIGIVKYANGKIVEEWKSYINPQDLFDPINVSIHGITKETVRRAPTIRKVSNKILSLLNNQIVVCQGYCGRTPKKGDFRKTPIWFRAFLDFIPVAG